MARELKGKRLLRSLAILRIPLGWVTGPAALHLAR